MRVHGNGTGARRRAVAGIALVLALAVPAGCGKEKLTNPIPMPRPSPYPKLVNPYSVLDALRTAYVARDTVEIKLLYDSAYQGSSIDLTDPSPVTLSFTKTDEVAHVARLARTPLFGISLTPANGLLRFHTGGDPPGWTTILNPFATLQISDSASTRSVSFSSEMSLFTFVPHPRDTSSVTDTTWKIVRWSEVRN